MRLTSRKKRTKGTLDSYSFMVRDYFYDTSTNEQTSRLYSSVLSDFLLRGFFDVFSFFLSTQKYSEYSLLSEKLSKVCLLTESKIQLHSVKAFHTISLWGLSCKKKQRKSRDRESILISHSQKNTPEIFLRELFFLGW